MLCYIVLLSQIFTFSSPWRPWNILTHCHETCKETVREVMSLLPPLFPSLHPQCNWTWHISASGVWENVTLYLSRSFTITLYLSRSFTNYWEFLPNSLCSKQGLPLSSKNMECGQTCRLETQQLTLQPQTSNTQKNKHVRKLLSFWLYY